MFTNSKQLGRWIAIAVAIGLFGSAGSVAKKPTKPPAHDDPASYTLVSLDDRAGSVRSLVRDVKIVNGTITCVGYLAEADGDKAVMWKVTPSESGFGVTTHYLADGEFAAAISSNGETVGECRTFDGEISSGFIAASIGQIPMGLLLRSLRWPATTKRSPAGSTPTA